MSERVKTAKLKLQIIGPTNISGSSELNTKDYMFNYEAGEVYILDQKEWFKLLNRFRALDSFEQYLMYELPKQNGRSMYQWAVDTLGRRNVNRNTLGAAVKSVMVSHYKKENGKNSLNDIVPQLRNARGHIYIPGSSIKGMIDKALIEHIILQNSRLRGELKDMLCKIPEEYRNIYDYRERKKTINNILRCAESKVNQAISCLVDGDGKTLKGALSSVFRGVSVSDAKPDENVTTEVLRKVDHGVEVDSRNSISVRREFILPGNVFEFSCTLDTSMTSNIGIYTVNDLLEIVEASYQRDHEILKREFHNLPQSVWNQAELANAYLGGNTGFLQKSIIMTIFKDNYFEGINVIKTILDIQFYKHKHVYKDKKISPRMIKLTEWNHKLWEVGGVRIACI